MSPPRRRSLLLLLLASLAGAAGLLGQETAGLPLGPVVDGEGLQVGRLELLGLSLSDIVTEPEMTPQRLRFNNIRAKLYGGEVHGRVDVSLPAGDVEISLRVKDFQLGAFLYRFAGIEDFDGSIDLQLDLRLPRGDWDTAHGTGTAHLRDGRVLKAPALASLLLGDPGGKKTDDRGFASFNIRAGTIYLKEAVVTNASWHVLGKGSIKGDGSLNLQISPFAKLDHLTIIPGVGDLARALIGGTSGRLARFDVTGPIGAPIIQAAPF